jgi:uncharacterized membrane protein
MSLHEVKADILIHAGPAHVFGIIADVARAPQWRPHVVEAHNKGRKAGLGAERILSIRFGSTDIVSHQRLVAFEPGARFGWSHLGDTVNGKRFDMVEDVGTDIRLAAKGRQTLVRATAHFRPRGIRAMLGARLFAAEIKEQMDESLQRLKGLAEATSARGPGRSTGSSR